MMAVEAFLNCHTDGVRTGLPCSGAWGDQPAKLMTAFEHIGRAFAREQ